MNIARGKEEENKHLVVIDPTAQVEMRPEAPLKIEVPMRRMEKFGIKFGIKGNRLKRIVSILDILYKAEPFSINDFSKKTDVTPRAIEKDIEFLRKQDIVEFQGARKTGRYVLTEKGKEITKEIVE